MQRDNNTESTQISVHYASRSVHLFMWIWPFLLWKLLKCSEFEYVRLKMAPKGNLLLVERLFGFQWLSLTAWSEKNYSSSLLFTPKYPIDKRSNTGSKLMRSRFDPYNGRKLKLFETQDHPRSVSKTSTPNGLVCKCLALFL